MTDAELYEWAARLMEPEPTSARGNIFESGNGWWNCHNGPWAAHRIHTIDRALEVATRVECDHSRGFLMTTAECYFDEGRVHEFGDAPALAILRACREVVDG